MMQAVRVIADAPGAPGARIIFDFWQYRMFFAAREALLAGTRSAHFGGELAVGRWLASRTRGQAGRMPTDRKTPA